MAGRIQWEPSRTLHEFRLLPGLTTDECTPDRVDLSTVLASRGQEGSTIVLSLPVVAAAMQAVSGDRMGIELGRFGGAAFVFCSQTVTSQAEMVSRIARGLSGHSSEVVPGPCAAAINTHDHEERVPALVEAGVRVLAIDSSDGHSVFQQRALAYVRERFPDLPVIAGNVITADGFDFLVSAGAWGVKVGMGSGSICITQEQKGTGRGLATAILDVVAARDRYMAATGRYVPVIADGGIGSAREIAVALAFGADAVMMGRYFAGLEESPSELVVQAGRKMKRYWGEGSARAREWREARYKQSVFEEGVEGLVPFAGRLEGRMLELCAMLRATFSTCGAATLEQLRRTAVAEVVSALSIREGQVHGIEQSPGPGGCA